MARRFKRTRRAGRDERGSRGRRGTRGRGERSEPRDPEFVDYTPIHVPRDAAARGVRARLYVAAIAGALTLLCLLQIVLGRPETYAFIALATMGSSGLLATVTLVLSARREEEVHQLASEMSREIPLLPAGEGGADGDP